MRGRPPLSPACRAVAEGAPVGGVTLRRELSKETLARRYYELKLPCVLVHFAYLRKVPADAQPTDAVATTQSDASLDLVKGAKSREAKRADFMHYQSLCSSLDDGSEVTYPGLELETDQRMSIKLKSNLLLPPGTSARLQPAEGAGDGGKDEDASAGEVEPPVIDVPVNVRYQQFTEFSSYTIDMPILSDKCQGPSGLESALAQGERLVELLKSLDGWWSDIPGDIFLVTIIGAVPSEEQRGQDPYDPQILQEVLSSDKDRQQPVVSSPGDEVGSVTPVGCLFDDGQIGLFTTYALQPFTEHLHVGILFNRRSSLANLKQHSRRIQQFLELEQYRLLCLSATIVAKKLFEEITVRKECKTKPYDTTKRCEGLTG